MAETICVIDDDRELCELIRITLETRGYKVIEAYDGEKGLNLIKKKEPDLIVLDLKMPKMNGYEVLNHLKNSAKLSTIPVIVLTVLTKGSRKSDEEWSKSTGVEDFITKPFDPLDLLKRVRKLLDVKQEPET
jgi:DNA-binding response OmpR family regulator